MVDDLGHGEEFSHEDVELRSFQVFFEESQDPGVGQDLEFRVLQTDLVDSQRIRLHEPFYPRGLDVFSDRELPVRLPFFGPLAPIL